MTLPALVLLPASVGLSPTQVGALLAYTGLMTLLFDLPAGGLADRYGHHKTCIAAAVVTGLGFLVSSQSHSFILFLVAQTLGALSRALNNGNIESWYVNTVPPEERDRALPNFFSGLGVVTQLTVGAGALTTGAYLSVRGGESGLREVYLLASVATLVYFLSAMSMRSLTTASAEASTTNALLRARQGVSSYLKSSQLRRLTLLLFGMTVLVVALEQMVPRLLAQTAGTAPGGAQAFGVTFAVGLAASALGSAIAPRLGVLASGTQRLASFTLASAVFAFFVSIFNAESLIIVGYVMAYFFIGLRFSSEQDALHAAIDGDDARVSVSSVYTILFAASNAVGSVALGFVASWSTRSAVVVASTVCAVSAIAFLRLDRAATATLRQASDLEKLRI